MTHDDERLEHELAAWLRQEAPDGAPAELRMAAIRAAREGRRLGWSFPARAVRQVVAFGAGGAAFLVFAVVVLALLSSSSMGPAGASLTPGVVGTSTPGPTHYPIVAKFPGVTAFPVLANGSIWAPQRDNGTVLRIDATTNNVLAIIPVGERPHAMATRGSEVWVSGRDDEGWALMRIDSQTNQVVERIGVEDEAWAMAISGDTIWMTSFESDLVKRIDLAARAVVAEIKLDNALGIAATDNDVWVALGGRGALARIDPADNTVSFISTGTQTTTMPLVIDDEVWLTTLSSEQVVIVSRAANEVVGQIKLQRPMGLAYQDGLIWVTDDSVDEASAGARVVAIDVATHEVVHALPLPGTGVDRAITVDGGSIWLVGDGLMRIDISEYENQ